MSMMTVYKLIRTGGYDAPSFQVVTDRGIFTLSGDAAWGLSENRQMFRADITVEDGRITTLEIRGS